MNIVAVNFTQPLSRMLASAIMLIGLYCTSAAQQSQPARPPGAPTVKDPQLDTLERQNREATLRSAELPVAIEAIDQKRIAAALQQMKEDFRRLQIVRNDVARSVLANKPFDYRTVSEETGEINKRADRLKTYLMPKAVADDKSNPSTPEADFTGDQMKGELARLCHLIDSFVENPALKSSGTVEAKQATKLIQDLNGIVRLSQTLKRSAEHLTPQ